MNTAHSRIVASMLQASRALLRRLGARNVNTTTIPVLFGSQTGTAKMMARQLARAAKSDPTVKAQGISLKAVSMASMTPQEVADHAHVVVVAASYGQGEPTDNAKEFFEGLKRLEDAALFGQTKVAVFGLGSSKTYPQRYQAFPRELEELLLKRGATPLVSRGEGDDSGDIEADFIKWKDAMWPALVESCASAVDAAGDGLRSGEAAEASHDDERDGHVDAVKLVDPRCLVHFPTTAAPEVEDSALKTYVGRVVRNDELYPNSRERSARHVEMEVPQEFRYEAGDHIGVLPHNHPELVYQFAASVMGPQYQSQRQLDWLLHAPASDHGGDLVPMWDPSHGALSGMTLRELLTTVVDLSGPATRSMIQTMAECAEDAAEASALADLASVSSGSQYDALVLKRRRRLVDMLEAYPSVKLPLTTALELLPRLEPRYYSISSAPEKHNNKVHLTVTVHRQPIEHQALLFEGCCSSYISRMSAVAPTSLVRVRHRPANFRTDSVNPPDSVVMVGAGSGIAPLRGNLHRLSALKAAGLRTPPASLYFGCRHEHSEYPYAEELRALSQEGVLAELVTAFSHDQPNMIFVQHRMAERGEQLWRQLGQQRGVLMVCGDGATLAVGVEQALRDVARNYGGLDEAGAAAWLESLRKEGRYLEDVFTNSG